MPSIRLVAVEGEAGEGASGTHSLPIYTVSPEPSLGGRSDATVSGKGYHFWNTVTFPSPEYSGNSNGYTDLSHDEIPSGYYWIDGESSGIQLYVSITASSCGMGPLKVQGTIVGSFGGVIAGADKLYGLGIRNNTYGSCYYLWYSAPEYTAGTSARVFSCSSCFTFDDIAEYIHGDSPYSGDTGHGGGAGDSGGTGGMGSGIDDGDQLSTHNDLDETAKQALLGYGLNAYVIDSGNLLALHKWLWGYDSDYMDALWKKWQNYKFNPMAGIVACHRLPNELKPATATAVNVKLAGITLQTSGGLTGVSAAPFSSLANRVWSTEYTVNINAPKGDFTDFANVQMGIFLPFCGTMALDPTQVMGRPGSPGVVRVQYCCNALTGDCTAFVRGTDQFGNTTMLGVANGNCAETHPLCGNDNGMSQKVSGLMSVVGGLAGSILTQNPAPAVGGAISGVSQVMAAQNHTQIIGQPGGANGWASLWTCYVYAYWNVPLDVNDDGEETGYYNAEYGRPSFVSASVSDFSGFTMLSLHADGIATASDEEKREIERLCSEGIII